MAVLRLSIEIYRMQRVIRIGDGCSCTAIASRGITAGSGLATFEMRLVLIRIIDKATAAFPLVVPTVYVDDMSAETTGEEHEVNSGLAGFGKVVCHQLALAEMEASKTKSICTASSRKLGLEVQAALSEHGIKFEPYVKSLGIGLAAGVRRNAKVINQRLKTFKSRLPGYKKLARAGHKHSIVLRTSGTACMTYAQFNGVADNTLRLQRSAAAQTGAPSGGTKGQSLDMALTILDGPSGRDDLAFQACAHPIVYWAEAVWCEWLDTQMLKTMVDKAVPVLEKASNI